MSPHHDGLEYPGVYAATANHDADMVFAVNDKSLCRVHIDNPQGLHPAPPDSSMSFYTYAIVANLERN